MICSAGLVAEFAAVTEASAGATPGGGCGARGDPAAGFAGLGAPGWVPGTGATPPATRGGLLVASAAAGLFVPLKAGMGRCGNLRGGGVGNAGNAGGVACA